jgi:uracil-DNA glycosylase
MRSGSKALFRSTASGGDGRPGACASTGSAADFLPARLTLPQLREASKTCRGCDLYCNATQTVFGEGPAHALAMFVGEQPGDQEDRAGKPFVGPAGALLDQALEAAEIPRDEVYVTNAVKHFKFEPRGTRRIHSKPSAREVKACRPWLEGEIKVVQPRMIVCLGATAAQSLMGSTFRLTQHRGEVIKTDWAPWLLATNHPSAVLRMPDAELRDRARRQFFEDILLVGKTLRKEMKAARH